MSEGLLVKCMDEITAISEECTIILHGGEPMSIGKALFRSFPDYGEKKRKEGKIINYDLQTNGMYIDQEWIELFKKYNISVGFSIDGPEKIHDRYRITRNGKGSHKFVVKNMETASRSGIDKNCLCVVTKDSVKDVDSVFEFFEGLSVKNIDFLPCMTENGKAGDQIDLTLSPEEYAEFIINFYELWSKSGRSYDVRSFTDFINILNKKSPLSCHLLYPKICGWEVISIDTDGDVYPCDSFAGHAEMRMGNIVTDGLEKIYSSKKSRDFYEIANSVPKDCESCAFLEYCYGGCLYHRYFRSGNLREKSYYCEAYKRIFRYLKKQHINNYANSIGQRI
jgi:uncharacterized protein